MKNSQKTVFRATMAGEDGEWSVGEYFPESLSLEKGTCAKQAVGQSCGALSTEAIGTLMVGKCPPSPC